MKILIHRIKLLSIMLFCTMAHANCSVSAIPVNFGNYNPLDNNVADSSGTITVNCTPGNTAYSVSLDGGLAGAVNNRKLSSSANNAKMFYNLYIDASRNIVWGNGTGNSQKVFANNNSPLTVYGRIERGQNAAVGAYGDTVTITVDF